MGNFSTSDSLHVVFTYPCQILFLCLVPSVALLDAHFARSLVFTWQRSARPSAFSSGKMANKMAQTQGLARLVVSSLVGPSSPHR